MANWYVIPKNKDIIHFNPNHDPKNGQFAKGSNFVSVENKKKELNKLYEEYIKEEEAFRKIENAYNHPKIEQSLDDPRLYFKIVEKTDIFGRPRSYKTDKDGNILYFKSGNFRKNDTAITEKEYNDLINKNEQIIKKEREKMQEQYNKAYRKYKEKEKAYDNAYYELMNM